MASPRLCISDDVRVGQFLDSVTKQGSRWVKMQPGNSTQSRKKRCIRFLPVVTLRSHRIAIVTCLHTCTGTANRLCKSHAMCKSAKSCAKGKVQITSFALAVQKSPACGCIVTAALLHHAPPLTHTHGHWRWSWPQNLLNNIDIANEGILHKTMIAKKKIVNISAF